MEKLIKIAAKELGIKEILGSQDNPRIGKYARDINMPFVNERQTAWCSIFLNWVAHKANFERSGKADARSWLTVGAKIADPEPGDVVIFWRESLSSWKGHVGLFMGFSVDKSRVYVLGGNQDDAVSISARSIDKLLEFRRLRRKDIRLSTETMKRGDKGPDVVLLQDALKMVGFNCGTSDGDFGPLTERAVKDLQRSLDELQVTGVFDRKSKEHLKELLK